MNALIIANTQIRRDDAGRYCLNDLHQASGGEGRHRPGRWLRLDSTAALVAEVEKVGDNCPDVGSSVAGIPAVETAEGFGGGTYAVKELVYAYAMWISAKFHLAVIRAYDALVTGQGGEATDTATPAVGIGPTHYADRIVGSARTFTALQRAGRAMGMSVARATRAANEATLRATGIDLAAEMDFPLAGLPMPIAECDPASVIAAFVHSQGKRGFARGKLAQWCRTARLLPIEERNAVYDQLIEEGVLIQYTAPGTRRTMLVHRDFAPVAASENAA